jgi:hypothetical protein
MPRSDSVVLIASSCVRYRYNPIDLLTRRYSRPAAASDEFADVGAGDNGQRRLQSNNLKLREQQRGTT